MASFSSTSSSSAHALGSPRSSLTRRATGTFSAAARCSTITRAAHTRSCRAQLPGVAPQLLHHWGSASPAPAGSSKVLQTPCPASRRSSRHICSATDERGTYTSSSSYTPHPWHDADNLRVCLTSAPYGPMKLFEDARGGAFHGVLVFKREADTTQSSDDLDVLEVFVAGDTAYNTWSLLSHQMSDRPMVHELMWTLLERAHGADARNWSLLRVAIVDLRENVFIGRLFFGDKETGQVLWDCDCRPSDGVYLSLRSECPFYIHRRVWDQAALPVRSSSVYKLVANSTQHATSSGGSASPVSSSPANGSSASSSQGSYQDPPYATRSGTPGGTFGRAERHVAPAGGSISGGGAGRGAQQAGEGEWQGKPANPLATAESLTMEDVTLIRPDDPDAIKLLKRQLLVAVAEENYNTAIRIRDHAWMYMYRDMHVMRLRGRYEDAHRVEMELKRQIEAVASTMEQ